MQFRMPNWLRKLLIVDDSVLDNQFALTGNKGTTDDDTTSEMTANSNVVTSMEPIKPVSLKEFIDKSANTFEHQVEDNHELQEDCIQADLNVVKRALHKVFHLPVNKDIVIREFTVGTEKTWRGIAVFVDGLADKTIINNFILQPLMFLTHIKNEDPSSRIEVIANTLLPGNQISILGKWSEVVPAILTGSTAVFFEHCHEAVIVETKGWEHRTVGLAQTENVVRGPHDAFTESLRANTGLIRAQFRSEHLVTEMFSIGKLARTDVAVMYVDGLTNPEIVKEVKKRIKGIEVDFLSDSGLLEQFIEDKSNMLIPQVLSTERPDRIANMLSEGHVAIFVGNSPFALAVPVVLWTLVHTPEDAYLRFPFGTFLRCLRWIALTVALLLPAFYVAITNYHAEMIPTDLMLAIAGSREQVPFPVVVEILLMEFAIELIREAGIRIPSVIGPTIGIVGALIIGQAAVQAGIVSPLLVIVVATTALAAFTIPNYNLNLAVRLGRFIFLFGAAILGFYGMAILMCMYIVRLSVQKSFGVPLLAPVAPSMDTSPDVLIRGKVYQMNERPSYLQTLRQWRQSPITRPWSSDTKPTKGRERVSLGKAKKTFAKKKGDEEQR